MVSKRVDFAGTINGCEYDLEAARVVEGSSEKQLSSSIIAADNSDGNTSTETGDASEPAAKAANNLDSTDAAQHLVVSDLSVYPGDSLEEKVDAFIQEHPVVMFNRTWCLFSIDACNFLVLQLQVSVHSIEVDIHPQGKEILKYVYEKTNYKTTPVIFIKGEFLGGFQEVNALYAQGKLEDEYLQGLSHADRCEAFISSSTYEMTPYFWFPKKVDGNVVRITGILTCFVSAITAALVHFDEFSWARYVAYAVAIDFMLRLMGGARFSVFGRIAMLFAYPLDPLPRMGRPKQFATCCGVAFSGFASLFYLMNFPYHDIVGSSFLGGLAIATFMEGFLDFCVGCFIFKLGIKLGIFKP